MRDTSTSDSSITRTRGGPDDDLARKFQCAVKGAFSQWVQFPPGNCRSSR